MGNCGAEEGRVSDCLPISEAGEAAALPCAPQAALASSEVGWDSVSRTVSGAGTAAATALTLHPGRPPCCSGWLLPEQAWQLAGWLAGCASELRALGLPPGNLGSACGAWASAGAQRGSSSELMRLAVCRHACQRAAAFVMGGGSKGCSKPEGRTTGAWQASHSRCCHEMAG